MNNMRIVHNVIFLFQRYTSYKILLCVYWYVFTELKLYLYSGKKDCKFLVRLFQFVPGDILTDKPYTPELCFEVGQLAGKLSSILKVGLYHQENIFF